MGSLNQEINLYRADSEQDRASSQARVLLMATLAAGRDVPATFARWG